MSKALIISLVVSIATFFIILWLSTFSDSVKGGEGVVLAGLAAFVGGFTTWDFVTDFGRKYKDGR